MNQIKNTLIGILIITILFFSGYGVGYYKQSNTTKIDTIGKDIKQLYKDRIVYVHDTIEVEVTKTKTKYKTDTLYVDSLFKNGNDSEKIALFDSIYPKLDTNYLMRITNSQAKDAINKSKAQYRDSLLAITYKKSADNCDTTAKKIVTKVDTLIQEKIVKKDNAIVGGLVGFTSAIILVICGFVFGPF